MSGPAESKLCETGTIPACGTRLIVGLIVYSAALPAGHVKEPSVSVPSDIGAYPAETATAEPAEEPDGLWRLLVTTLNDKHDHNAHCGRLWSRLDPSLRERTRIVFVLQLQTTHLVTGYHDNLIVPIMLARPSQGK